MEYDTNMTGILFKNESDNPNAPWYKGKITVEGKEYELAAWVREGKQSGKKFLSLKVQEPYEKRDTSQSNMQGAGNHEPSMGSDLPF